MNTIISDVTPIIKDTVCYVIMLNWPWRANTHQRRTRNHLWKIYWAPTMYLIGRWKGGFGSSNKRQSTNKNQANEVISDSGKCTGWRKPEKWGEEYLDLGCYLTEETDANATYLFFPKRCLSKETQREPLWKAILLPSLHVSVFTFLKENLGMFDFYTQRKILNIKLNSGSHQIQIVLTLQIKIP